MLLRAPGPALLASIAVGAAALVLAPARLGAVPTDCPEVAGARVCVLAAGRSEIAVRVSAANGGLLQLDRWVVDGRDQLAFEGFSVRDFDSSGGTEIVVPAATVDAEAGEILVELAELASGLRVSVRFSLQDGEDSVVEETITVFADLISISARLYVVNDFDLDDDPLDSLAFADPQGHPITQSDGPVSASVEWIGGERPGGFDVAPCCLLGTLLGDATFVLAGRTTALGPANFQSAMSWDRELGGGQNFAVVLRKTVAVPEADAPASVAACVVGLTMLRCRPRRGRGTGEKRPAVRDLAHPGLVQPPHRRDPS